MKSALAIFLLTVLIGVQSDSNPVITIDPNIIYARITKTLEVKCIFTQTANQTFGKIFSLALLHSRISAEQRFSFLASVNIKSHPKTYSALQDHYELNGQINNTGDSYVKITWKYPAKNRGGVYKCEVRVDENLYGLASASSSMPLKAESPRNDMVIWDMRTFQDRFNKQISTTLGNKSVLERKVLEQLQDTRLEVDNLTQSILSTLNKLQREISNEIRNEISNINDQISSIPPTVNQLQSQISNQIRPAIDKMKGQIETSKTHVTNAKDLLSLAHSTIYYERNRLKDLKKNQDHMKKNVTLARQANFISSSSFMGRHYWLPKMTTSYFSYIYAHAACMNFGGYLAEVNSKDELVFLRNFLRQNGREFTSVCLGGTYVEHETIWSGSIGGKLYLQFQDGIDIYDRRKNCISLNGNRDFKMYKEHCSLTSRKRRLGFICEVPDKLNWIQ